MMIALTGSIAVGKSETARMFAAAGIPVFDSDDVVHELYSAGGEAVDAIGKLVPEAARKGFVDRRELSIAVQRDQTLIRRVEAIVHPLVRQLQSDFVIAATALGAPLFAVDIPLLFETNRQDEPDRVVLVTCSAEIQRERAMARQGMTDEKLDFILSRQIPDSDKRTQADFVVDTSSTIAETRRQVETIIHQLLDESKGDSNA